MDTALAQPVTRADIVAWSLSAVALAIALKLQLLPALLAGLLVYELVNVLTPWLRLSALGRDGPRLLAVTLIATVVIAALAGAGLGLAAFLRNSGESLPILMQRMAQIVEDARAQSQPGCSPVCQTTPPPCSAHWSNGCVRIRTCCSWPAGTWGARWSMS